MNKKKPASERIKIRPSQSVYFSDDTKNKIFAIADSGIEDDGLSTIIKEAIELLYKKVIKGK